MVALNSGSRKDRAGGEGLSARRRAEGGGAGAAWKSPLGVHADLIIAHGHCRSGVPWPSSREDKNVRAAVFFGAIIIKDESLAVGVDG